MEANEPAKPGAETKEGEAKLVSGTVVTFEANVRLVAYDGQPVRADNTEFDRRLAEELWDNQALHDRLAIEAKRTFEDEFDFRVVDAHPSGSVHLIAVLYAAIPQRVDVSAFRAKLTSFTEVLRQAIHDVSAEGLYDLTVDVTARGAVLSDPAAASEATKASAWDRIGAVLAAVGTGIGVLGFVAFVGAAIEFARLENAGLPAEEAVAVIPKANLVAIGAGVLVPALMLAVAAAALLYAWELAAAAWYRAQAKLQSRTLSSDPLVTREGLADEVTDALRFAPTPGRRAKTLALLLFALETVAFFVLFGHGVGQIFIFLVLALLTSGAVFMVAVRTRAFVWVVVTAFLATGVFSSCLAYARTKDSPKVRPAAAMREGNTMTGFFIAETASQIYIGREPISGDTPAEDLLVNSRIVVLPKDEISDLSIGPLMNPSTAYDRAQEMAYELCDVDRHASLRAIARAEAGKRTECERMLLRSSRHEPE